MKSMNEKLIENLESRLVYSLVSICGYGRKNGFIKITSDFDIKIPMDSSLRDSLGYNLVNSIRDSVEQMLSRNETVNEGYE